MQAFYISLHSVHFIYCKLLLKYNTRWLFLSESILSYTHSNENVIFFLVLKRLDLVIFSWYTPRKSVDNLRVVVLLENASFLTRRNGFTNQLHY